MIPKNNILNLFLVDSLKENIPKQKKQIAVLKISFKVEILYTKVVTNSSEKELFVKILPRHHHIIINDE